MNKNNLTGLIIVAIFIVGIFTYIDLFDTTAATNPSISNSVIASSTPLIIPEDTMGTMTLALNDQRKVGDTTLLVSSVTEDSRCPRDVTCVQAGKVLVNVRLSSQDKDWSLQMKPGDSVFTPAVTLTLIDVLPVPVQDERINNDDYQFIFNVKQTI